MKVLFTCGGTAGHINPAVAVAMQLQSWDPSTEVLFIGAEGKMEMDLVPREGYEIRGITITNLSREKSLQGLKHNIGTIRNVVRSSAEAKRILREFAPDAVVGTGGYVCYPVIRAAHLAGIPTAVHESNARPGLTTRMLARMADRVLVGMEGCASAYPDPKKVTVTGTPVRGGFDRGSKSAARQELGIGEEEKLVLSVWGSLGAGYLNEIMLQIIPELCRRDCGFRLIHVTGRRYYAEFMEKLRATCPDWTEHGIDVREYLHDMPRVMAAADLVMCRSGASTLSELAYMAKPALLVPSPNVVANHQEKNARVVEQAGAAKVLLEGEFTAESLLAELSAMTGNSDALQRMAEASGALCEENAAEAIAAIVKELAEG